ncbi:MAG: hypothetical protein WCA89_08860 [Terracidiphilus sp.]
MLGHALLLPSEIRKRAAFSPWGLDGPQLYRSLGMESIRGARHVKQSNRKPEKRKMENRGLSTVEGIHAELIYRAGQEWAAASIGRTSKQRTAEAERAACALESLAAAVERTTTKEHFPHDVCPGCSKPSIPLEGVPDQSGRGCGACGRERFEDLSKPATWSK